MREPDSHEQGTFSPLVRKIVLVLNGPPGVGKDTLAELLEHHEYNHGSFKTELYRETANHYNLPLELVVGLCTNRETKEVPQGVFKGKSPRKALQYVSEEVIKPVWGKGYFGSILGQSCENQGGNFVISDGGFHEEITPLLEYFDTVYICRLHRKGFDFSNDTRTYLYSEMGDLNRRGIVFFDVNLDEDKPQAGAATIELAVALEEGI